MFVSCVFFGDCQNLSTNLAPELSYHCIPSISSYCALSLSDVSVMLKQLLLCYTCSHLLIFKFNVFSSIGTGIERDGTQVHICVKVVEQILLAIWCFSQTFLPDELLPGFL